MNNVTASVIARFGAGGDSEISIEGDPGVYADGFDNVHLLLHPADSNISVYASVGQVVRADTTKVIVPSGAVQFSGGETAQLPKRPVYTQPQLQVLFAFDAKTGAPTDISVHYDGDRNVLAVNKPVYAAVRYSKYESASRRLIYTPKKITLAAGGFSFEYGTIAAFLPPDKIITHDVQPAAFNNGNDETELYRIVSDVVTTPDGEFEKPPAYPTNGSYPGGLPPIDVSTALLTERVHEIGYMDSLGRAWIKEYFRPNIAPYVGALSFAPTKRLVESTVPVEKFGKALVLQAKNIVSARKRGKL